MNILRALIFGAGLLGIIGLIGFLSDHVERGLSYWAQQGVRRQAKRHSQERQVI